MGWEKFALPGAMYARALQNAAQRSGARVAPQLLNHISAQPQATPMPGLAAHARTPVAPAFTPQEHAMNQRMQGMMSNVPFMTQDNYYHPRDAYTGLRQFHGQAKRYNQISSQPGVDAAIHASFGPAHPPTMRPPVEAPVSATDATAALPMEGTAVSGPAARRRMMGKAASALSTAAGVGIPLALGGGMLLNKPGIHSNVKNLFADKGSTQEQDLGGELHPTAVGHAEAIHNALTEHGLDPSSLRMGIDAPPGSGKTSLARAVAQRSGMRHHGLDWEPGNWWKSTVGMGRNVEATPHAPQAGEILEHYMLGRTHNPELFDAMVHIRKDPEVIKQQLRSRGNAAYISDMMSLEKSLGVAALGFDTLDGDAIHIGDGVEMKLRPKTGWGHGLEHQLMMKGINPEGLTRHERLLSLHEGARTTGAGWTPYVKNPFTPGESVALGASVPLGIMAARALSRRPV